MEKTEAKNKSQPPLKISILETIPIISDIAKNKEEISIVFQSNNNFYDLKKCISSKIPIQLTRYKNSIVITLIKSNKIFATGILQVKPGEQAIILNYENKTKKVSTKFSLNSIDYIKIKIKCEIDGANNSNISSNLNNISNTQTSNTNIEVNKNINVNKHMIPKRLNDKKKKFINNYSNNIISTFGFNNNIISSTNNSITLKNISQEFNGNNSNNPNNIFLQNDRNYNSNTNPNYHTIITYCSKTFNVKEKKLNHSIKKNDNSDYLIKANSNNKFALNKAKSKNNITLKKNKLTENSVNNNINTNISSSRVILKTKSSFGKLLNRNLIFNSILNSNYNLMNSSDNLVHGKIVEDAKKSKIQKSLKENNNFYYNSEKKKIDNLNSRQNIINANVTLNSSSTTGTKFNDFEFSINSNQEDDKHHLNKFNLLENSCKNLNSEKERQRIKITYDQNKEELYRLLNQQYTNPKNTIEIEENFNNNIKEGNKDNIENKDNIDNNENKKNKESEDIIENDENKENNENKENIDNIENNGNKDNIENKNNEDNKDKIENNEEEENYFTKIKEDFDLMYNEEHINEISNDLLKFELELLIEKISELFSAYHLVMDDKILENKILKKNISENIEFYMTYHKLNNKLKFAKEQKNIKESKYKSFNEQYKKNLNINGNEIDFLKKLIDINLNSDKFKKLKFILNHVLNKKKNRDLLDEKYKKLFNAKGGKK